MEIYTRNLLVFLEMHVFITKPITIGSYFNSKYSQLRLIRNFGQGIVCSGVDLSFDAAANYPLTKDSLQGQNSFIQTFIHSGGAKSESRPPIIDFLGLKI